MARTNGRRRVLLAHDLGAPTCDSLLSAIDDAFNDVEVVEVASAPDAQSVLERSRFDACFVCLDLPPAPLAGVRLAQAALRSSSGREGSSGRQRRAPTIVLVTRSLRWLPPSAAELRSLPWVAPDAGVEEIAKAVDEATRRVPTAPTSGWDTRPSDASETTEVMLAGGVEEAPRARRRRGR